MSIYGECQKPITCPDGLVAVKRWRGDWEGVCRSQCAINQYRDGYKNGRYGTMECRDCRTTEGFYAYKIDQFLEARECKKAPIGYLVNAAGDDYIHEDQCPNGQIQGKQCMEQEIEICAPGKYWDNSECSSPPSGKKQSVAPMATSTFMSIVRLERKRSATRASNVLTGNFNLVPANPRA